MIPKKKIPNFAAACARLPTGPRGGEPQGFAPPTPWSLRSPARASVVPRTILERGLTAMARLAEPLQVIQAVVAARSERRDVVDLGRRRPLEGAAYQVARKHDLSQLPPQRAVAALRRAAPPLVVAPLLGSRVLGAVAPIGERRASGLAAWFLRSVRHMKNARAGAQAHVETLQCVKQIFAPVKTLFSLTPPTAAPAPPGQARRSRAIHLPG